jgi:hypothetical protein
MIISPSVKNRTEGNLSTGGSCPLHRFGSF